MAAVLQIDQRDRPDRLVQIEFRPFRLEHRVRPDVRQNEEFERQGGDTFTFPKGGQERAYAVMRERGVTAARQFLRASQIPSP